MLRTANDEAGKPFAREAVVSAQAPSFCCLAKGWNPRSLRGRPQRRHRVRPLYSVNGEIRPVDRQHDAPGRVFREGDEARIGHIRGPIRLWR